MKTISPQVLLEIMKVFHQIDKKASGSIIYADLVVALRTLSLAPTIRSIYLILSFSFLTYFPSYLWIYHFIL